MNILPYYTGKQIDNCRAKCYNKQYMKKPNIAYRKVILVIFLIFFAAVAGFMAQIISQLPDVSSINSYLPSEATIIYADDGQVLARLHEEENRQVVPLSKISPNLINAVIATEDKNFYSHHGIDLAGIARATVRNISAGRIKEGGSTITQQLAKNLFLTKKRSFIRKISEAILALQIERRFSKEEILELYLNQIYWGHNAYGIEAASFLYFGKTAKELTLAEASVLAGIIEAPERLSPYKNLTLAKKRQKIILVIMVRENKITLDQAKAAYTEELILHPEKIRSRGQIASYFISYILGNLMEKYGSDLVYKGGLKVHTTLNVSMQAHAERVIDKFIGEEGKKYRFSQAALLSLNPRNGHIKSMVGGADFYKSQFNRAVQAQRPPGSSFKPFVYAAAIEKGMSPGTILADQKTTFHVYPNKWNPKGTWAPNNFNKKFNGNVTMREALERSLNIPTIKLLKQVGIAQTINMARRMGIKSKLEYALAISLGVYDVNLLEMTSAYGVLANRGIRAEPIAITKILSRDDIILEENKPKETRVLGNNTAAVMVDMMKGVLQRGTGYRGRLLREAAAKTGTTEEFRDAWFIGFVPQLVTGVWVGNDNNKSMKGVAEVAVCPRLWKAFMKQALKDQPALRFEQPEGLVKIQICRDSGLRPHEYCPKERILSAQYFKNDVPLSSCYFHTIIEEEEEEELEEIDKELPEWLEKEDRDFE